MIEQKGYFRASKRQKKKPARYPCPTVFFELFRPKREDVLECWTHKVLTLGPALLSALNVIRYLICGKNKSWLLKLNLNFEALYTWTGSCLLDSQP